MWDLSSCYVELFGWAPVFSVRSRAEIWVDNTHSIVASVCLIWSVVDHNQGNKRMFGSGLYSPITVYAMLSHFCAYCYVVLISFPDGLCYIKSLLNKIFQAQNEGHASGQFENQCRCINLS